MRVKLFKPYVTNTLDKIYEQDAVDQIYNSKELLVEYKNDPQARVVDLEKVCAKITFLEYEDWWLTGKIVFLPKFKFLEDLVKKEKLLVRPKGSGRANSTTGVIENYKFLCFTLIDQSEDTFNQVDTPIEEVADVQEDDPDCDCSEIEYLSDDNKAVKAKVIKKKSKPAPPVVIKNSKGQGIYVENVTERRGKSVSASTVRPATQLDIDLAEAQHKIGQCPHNVIVDEAGYMYDFRNCHTCGTGLGTI